MDDERQPTKAQRKALYALYRRSPYAMSMSYLAFRRTARVSHSMGCIMVPFCGMWVGIESDGFTHS